YWHQLFSGRISEIIFCLVLWSLFLIYFKWGQFLQQHRAYAAFRNQLLHDSFKNGIYMKDVDEHILRISQFLQDQKVKKFQDSVIFRRVRRTLRHLKAIPKKEEITSILNYQAEIDHNRMQSSYALLNVFIWAIPIFGFIGTVFGIGQSIGEFSDFIRSTNSTDMNTQIRSALGGVTSGLSVAFSTTFIALVGVVPIMMLASSLRKREEDLLLSVEEYCLEDLLPNLHLRPGDELLDDAVTGHLEQMADFAEDWRKQVSPVLKSVEQYSKGLAAQVRGLQPLIQKFSESLFEAKDEMGEIKKVEKNNEKSASTKTEDLQGEGLMNNSKASNR
ncbi:MAG: MotA/TolQ/ExbB proton channel family protein, partial [SAR324 cluster bacterium]|nr:MotA/TolQ/ExbB proton channel family protein [SAR324 cluster bacterium]